MRVGCKIEYCIPLIHVKKTNLSLPEVHVGCQHKNLAVRNKTSIGIGVRGSMRTIWRRKYWFPKNYWSFATKQASYKHCNTFQENGKDDTLAESGSYWPFRSQNVRSSWHCTFSYILEYRVACAQEFWVLINWQLSFIASEGAGRDTSST